MKNESVMDFPKDGLCPDIWAQGFAADGATPEWVLQPEVREQLLKVAAFVFEHGHFNPDFMTLHITGSITSNSFTENADIDLHFLFKDGHRIREFSEITQGRVKDGFEALKAAHPELAKVGSHPIEVYYQPNEFQDYMSVGCYDVMKQEWEVGPELKDSMFNPYSEYYKEVQEKSSVLASQIRSLILRTYEQAIVCKKILQGSDSDTFAENMLQLESLLTKDGELFDKIREMRKVYSDPQSKEEALKFRSSRKWKIADATFKLFDKYGYMTILKQMKTFSTLVCRDIEMGLKEELLDAIIKEVKNGIGNAEKLADSEVDEGLGDAVKVSALAALLAVPGLLPAKTVQKAIDKSPTYSQVMSTLNQDIRMVGEYNAFQAANIIARTLYAEARNDGLEKGYKPVASVIYNRAKGDPAAFAAVCKKKLQFSCWNKMTDAEWDPAKFEIKIPKTVKGNAKNEKLWKQAMEVAADMLAGAFKPITTANSYYNPDKAAPSWGKELTKVSTIGSHKFGYLKNHVAFT